MLKNIRRFSALLLLASAVQDPESPVTVPDRDQIFFHPVITVLSLAAKELPACFALTYERHMDGGVSLVLQPQLALGAQEIEDTEISQFSVAGLLGLRRYFNGTTRGMYMQAAGFATIGTLKAEQKGTSNSGEADMSVYGILGYLGYKWTHVFMDIGVGFQAGNGTVELNNGTEVDISARGRAMDLNLGFGF